MDAVGLVLSGLLNAVVIAAVARRLLGVPVGWPRTLLLALLVNAGTSPLLTWSSERLGIRPADGRPSLATLLIVVLVIAWVVALQVGLLVILEALVPTGSLPGPGELLRGLPSRMRRSRRYTQIVRIAARHGLGRYLTRRGAQVTAQRAPSTMAGQPDSATARHLSEALSDGGVTFVKFGQMLSTRTDLIGPAYAAELSRLHADVPAQPWSVVQETLWQELGDELNAVFEDIDQTPLAAASVGQVHRARLHDGRPVVVKVQRADARAQATADLDIVLRLAARLDRSLPWARRLGVADLAAGFAASIEEELDYRVEARNMAAIAAATTLVQVPTVHRATQRVLIMDAAAGVPLSKADLSRVSPQRRRELARQLLDSVLEQVLDNGVFHADLHAGNILYDEASDSVTLLDFGSVGRLDRGSRTSLGLLLLAVDRQDAVASAQALIDLLDAPAVLDARTLERELGQLIMRHSAGGDVESLVVDLMRLVLRHGLRVPPSIAASFRCLGALDGTLKLLSPDLDMVAVARERGSALLSRDLGPGGVRSAVEDQLVGLLPMLQRLPRQVSSIIEDVEQGRFTVTVRALQGAGERKFLTGLVQQLVLSVLAATTALAGTALALAGRGPMMTDVVPLSTFCGMLLLLFAVVLGCRVAVLVFRRDPD